jgi:electron transport complex protein RnfG
MREIIKPALVLFIVCAVTTVVLAGVKTLTQGTIDQRAAHELEEAKRAVLPAAASFAEIASTDVAKVKTAAKGNEYLATIEAVYVGKDASGAFVGSVYALKSRGYDAEGVKLTVGMNQTGAITDIRKGDNKETPGLGTNVLEPEGAYMPQYRGKAFSSKVNLVKMAPSQPDDIQAVAGATITSRAVSRAVQGALEFSRLLDPNGELK